MAARQRAGAKSTAQKNERLPRLSVEQIEAADDIRTAEVDVPEWGGSVKLRGLSKAEWETYTEKEAPDDIQFLLVTAFVEPEITLEEAERLRSKSITAVGRVEGAILDCCGLGATLEQIEKRFLAGDAG